MEGLDYTKYLRFTKEDLFQVESDKFACFKSGAHSPSNNRSIERELIALQGQLVVEKAARIELELQLKQASVKIALLQETVDKYSQFFN